MKSFGMARLRAPWSLVLVFALTGFLLVITSFATSAATKTAEPRKNELISQILQQRSNVDDLDKAVTQLRGQVASAQEQAGRLSNQEAQQSQKYDLLALQAGTSPVKGSGLEVKLADAPQSRAAFGTNRIQDSDIQLVVNALFASGAEAVDVNGNRVVVVTPIRAAGGTIVVNYRPVNSPYVVDGIGANKDEFNQSVIAQNFQQWKKKFQLGFSVEKRSGISMGAYSGRVSIDQAQVPASSTTTSIEPSTTTAAKQ
jgi:uncharacterized protein YlxW (UPF0749 family)